MNTLSQLSLPASAPFTLAAVGGGGKTSCLFALARRYRTQGRSVLLTTTTHMRQTDAAFCSSSLAPLEQRLGETGFLFTGTPVSDGKLGPLPAEQYAALSRQAQVTLVEADGSRRLPLKMPAAWEPVLPPETGHVLVLLGLSGLGSPLRQVCHRWELAAQALECSGETLITPILAARLLELAYLRPLRAHGLPFTVLLNQADTVPEEAALELQEALSPDPALILSLQRGLNAAF
ncbi:MAG: selenium cofactor biosynthesis protein YqeC [Candidatus Onthomonas sp.]